MKFLLSTLSVVLIAGIAHAGSHNDWVVLEDHSSIGFGSTKNGDITEAHSFSGVTGELKESGKLTVSINLASVDTNIPIRDERMQRILFAAAPTATYTAMVDPALVSQPPMGMRTINGELSLNGKTLAVPLNVVFSTVEQGVRASTSTTIDVAEFGYAAGIDELRNIAGLQSISTEVPVTIELILDKKSHH